MGAAKKPSRSKEKNLQFDFPDTKASIQLALHQVMNAIGASQISSKRAGSLLYSLQIATQTVPPSLEIVPKKPVLCVSETPEGDEVAPECMSFDVPCSCADCIHPDPKCPLHDKNELQILAIAHGVDKPGTEQRSLHQTFNDELVRYLNGGVMPEARTRIRALMRQAKAEAGAAAPPELNSNRGLPAKAPGINDSKNPV